MGPWNLAESQNWLKYFVLMHYIRSHYNHDVSRTMKQENRLESVRCDGLVVNYIAVRSQHLTFVLPLLLIFRHYNASINLLYSHKATGRAPIGGARMMNC